MASLVLKGTIKTCQTVPSFREGRLSLEGEIYVNIGMLYSRTSIIRNIWWEGWSELSGNPDNPKGNSVVQAT